MSLVPYNLVALAEDETIGGGKNIIAGATVNIIKSGGGSAQIYSDELGLSLIVLPTVTGANGELNFFIEQGSYNFIINGESRRVDVIGQSIYESVAQTIQNVSQLSSIEAVDGRIYDLKEYESGSSVGGGVLIGKSGVIDPDNINTFASADPAVYFYRTNYNSNVNRDDIDYRRAPRDFSGLVQQHGKNVVITGDSLSYNNYGFGFPFAATAQEANAGIRSWGFLLRDAIHMSDPCFTYGDNIPWHINNSSYAAVAVNNTSPFVLPFNNRSLRCVVNDSDAEITLTVSSFNIANKQVVLHLAHSPGQPGKFDVYYNDNSGGADVFVENIEVGNGVDHQGYEPFTLTIPVNTLDSCARIILKNFTDENDDPVTTSLAFFVLASGSKLTNVYTTGVGGQTSEYFVTNFSSKIGVYNPDLLVICIGANDRVSYGIDRHLAALSTIFENARSGNPEVRIILITAPPAVGVDNPGFYPDSATAFGVNMKSWVSSVQRLCDYNDVIFFNQYRFFYGIDSSYLFVDGIHLTRNAGRDVFKALVSEYFANCGAPIEHLSGYSTYSVAGTGDLMGRQIGSIETTKAAPRLRGQFKITYNHGSFIWTVSDSFEHGTFKPSALRSITIDGSAHTNIIEFYVPVAYSSYNEFPSPLNAVAEYIGGASVLISGLSIKPYGNNSLVFSIRDGSGALIDPSTMNGAQFLIKYF